MEFGEAKSMSNLTKKNMLAAAICFISAVQLFAQESDQFELSGKVLERMKGSYFVSIVKEGQDIFIDYPGFGCGGKVTVIEQTDTTMSLQANIDRGVNGHGCPGSGFIRLTDKGSIWLFEWSADRNGLPTVSGGLKARLD